MCIPVKLFEKKEEIGSSKWSKMWIVTPHTVSFYVQECHVFNNCRANGVRKKIEISSLDNLDTCVFFSGTFLLYYCYYYNNNNWNSHFPACVKFRHDYCFLLFQKIRIHNYATWFMRRLLNEKGYVIFLWRLRNVSPTFSII